jgi:hypothetical protein
LTPSSDDTSYTGYCKLYQGIMWLVPFPINAVKTSALSLNGCLSAPGRMTRALTLKMTAERKQYSDPTKAIFEAMAIRSLGLSAVC